MGTSVPPVGDGVQNLNFSTSTGSTTEPPGGYPETDGDNTEHDNVPEDYIASNVTGGLWVGQGFTTAAGSSFYQLNSISVRQVGWGPTNWDFDGGQVSIRIFRVDTQDGAVYNTTVIKSATASIADSTTTTIGGTPTTPEWLTFQFATPLVLNGSAEYAFAFKSNATIDGATNNFLMEVDGVRSDVYAGGCSISVPDGVDVLWKGGGDNDRAFVANMSIYNAAGDTDVDGLPDSWELSWIDVFDLFDLTGLKDGPGPGIDSGDFDGDGVSDLEEYNGSSDPTDEFDFVDSDSDGLPDAWETGFAGNLTDLNGAAAGPGPGSGTGDFDGDGYTDLEEYQALDSPFFATQRSNPLVAASTPYDTDADGLTDDWELFWFFFLDAETGAGDYDGDFDTNAAEEAAGTDPTDPLDFVDSDSDGISDGWETLVAGNLTDLDGSLPAGSGPGAGTGDFDGDGFSDLEEYQADPQSDPTDVASTPVDTDGDGLTDAWEITNFGNIGVTTGTEDSDGDYETNAAEEAGGTDPNDPGSYSDTEPDGLGDGWELFFAGNLTDLDGSLAGPGPGAGTGDFDDDGFSDLQEFQYKTDPTDNASVPVPVISVNYNTSWSSTPPLAAGDTAGVVPAANWNNVTDANNAITFYDQANISTPLTVSFSASGGWGWESWNTVFNPDEDMFSDKVTYYGGAPLNLNLSNVPYATYDLYLYMSSWGNEVVNFSLNGGATTIATLTNMAPNPNNYVEGNDYRLNDTYVKISGLTGDQVVSMTNVSDWVHLAGFQIVDAGPLPSVPTFFQQPQDTTGYVGQALTLPTSVASDPAPTVYQWQYSADALFTTPIDLVDGGAVSGATTSTLVINPAATSDAGFYRLYATNTNDTTFSDVVEVTVVYPNPAITDQPDSVARFPGENADLTVVANGVNGLVDLTYQWYKVDGGGDIALTDSGPYSGTTSATLSITGLTLAEQGQYYVIVTDHAAESEALPATTSTSAVATVTVVDLAVTVSDTQPVINGGDIAWFPANPELLTDADNVANDVGAAPGDDNHTYIAADRPSQGMSFTTGDNGVDGYNLKNITVQQVLYTPTFWNVQPGFLFQIAFGSLSGTTKTELYSTSKALVVGPGFPGTPGSFLTFDFTGEGIALDSNTEYYFEITTTTTGFGYFELNGTSADGYAGGAAFSGGVNGQLTPATYVTRTGDGPSTSMWRRWEFLTTTSRPGSVAIRESGA